MKDGDVDGTAGYTLLGDWATPSDAQYYPSTRTSDFMLDHFRSYQAATGDSAWSGLRDSIYGIVDALQTSYSPSTGLLPDFVTNPITAPQPAPANFLESPNDGAYYYNACRDPWRLATDYLVSGDARAKTAVQRTNTWIRGVTGGDPHNIQSGYGLDGSTSPANDYLSMAFVAPLGVGAMVDGSNQAWLDALWDLEVGTPITTDGYYENTLKLLSLVVMSGNWWAPESMGTPTCDAGGTPLCMGGGTVSGAQIVVGKAGDAPGAQTLRFDGRLFFPEGTPVAPLTGGAQLLVEDLGAGGTAVFDLTTATDPVPSAADGACDPAHDGWSVGGSKTTYRNRSTAIDPPTCTPGSGRGLYQLRYRTRSSRDLDFSARAKRSTIAAVTGPLRGTIVLGKDAAAGQGGACGLTASLACTATAAKVRCR